MKLIFQVSLALGVLGLLASGCSPAENDVVVLEVGPSKVTLAEYESFFARNSGGVESGRSSSMNDREHFLDLLTNYRLKLQDAFDKNIQNDPELKQELTDYRSSLAATYLIEKEVTDPGVQLMYDRRHEEVRAQQILVTVKTGSRPEDTLAGWTRTMDIIKNAQAGANFDSLALEYSNDPSVRTTRGDTYYFTSGQMTAPFENAAYALHKGEISTMPVRSPLGYHVVKLLDRIPSRGSMSVSHIMARFKVSETDSADTASALRRILALQDSLKKGWGFSKLAVKFSEDQGSAQNGGDLGWFERRRWVQPFDEACFKLEPGQTSGIIRTSFGYHLIHCDSVKPVPPFADVKEELKKRYQQNRYNDDYALYIAGLKKEFRYSFSDSAFGAFASRLDSMKVVGDSAWSDAVPQNIRQMALMSVDGKTHTTGEVLSILDKRQEYRNTLLRKSELQPRLDRIAESLLFDAKSGGLESRSAEFASLMKDYENGMILFKAEQMEVWNKVSVTDSALHSYYNDNKRSFMFPERVEFSEIHVAADTLAYLLYDSVTHGGNFASFASRYNEDPDVRNKRGAHGFKPINSDELTTIAGKLNAGEISEPTELEAGGYSIILVTKREQPREKTFDEAGAEVSNQYQEFLSKKIEKDWVERIRTRYAVKQYKERLRGAFGEQPASH